MNFTRFVVRVTDPFSLQDDALENRDDDHRAAGTAGRRLQARSGGAPAERTKHVHEAVQCILLLGVATHVLFCAVRRADPREQPAAATLKQAAAGQHPFCYHCTRSF